MDRNNNVSPEILKAKMKANLLYSRLLDFVRGGNTTAIRIALDASDYPCMVGLIIGNDLDFARTVMQFLTPQIARAAIEGGMAEMDAAAVYLDYMKLVNGADSSEELMSLNRRMIIDYSERVAVLHFGEHFTPITAKCLEYISEHVCDPLTARHIAVALHVSRSYLSHVYKMDTGRTIGERIRAEKITMAKILLRHTTLNLAEISQEIGFSSQSHFTEMFRKMVGVTPKNYCNCLKSTKQIKISSNQIE